MCYKHAGDGVCEDFERRSSPEDCGWFTPASFTDHWVVEARAANLFSDATCPLDAMLGEPAFKQVEVLDKLLWNEMRDMTSFVDVWCRRSAPANVATVR